MAINKPKKIKITKNARENEIQILDPTNSLFFDWSKDPDVETSVWKTCFESAFFIAKHTFPHVPVSLLLAVVMRTAPQFYFDHLNELSSAGFPESIRKIFNCKNKKEVRLLLRQLCLQRKDLSMALLFNCKQLGYKYRKFHKIFLPNGLRMTSGDESSLLAGDVKALKAYNKLAANLDQRVWRNAFLFEKSDEWHVFYFDMKEACLPSGKNHYKCEHVHYVSHLFGVNKEEVWNKLTADTRTVSNIPSEHVMIEPQFDLSEPKEIFWFKR